MKRTVTVLSCAVVCLAATGIAQTAAGSGAALEDLIKKVLVALESKDQAALEKLAITEDGYRKYIWPGIPGNTPGADEKKFYGMFQQGSAAGISSALKEFGGHKLEFVKVTLGNPIRQTKAYRLLPPPAVTVKDSSGQEKTIQLTGAVVEHDGSYQIATFGAPSAQPAGSQQASR